MLCLSPERDLSGKSGYLGVFKGLVNGVGSLLRLVTGVGSLLVP